MSFDELAEEALAAKSSTDSRALERKRLEGAAFSVRAVSVSLSSDYEVQPRVSRRRPVDGARVGEPGLDSTPVSTSPFGAVRRRRGTAHHADRAVGHVVERLQDDPSANSKPATFVLKVPSSWKNELRMTSSSPFASGCSEVRGG